MPSTFNRRRRGGGGSRNGGTVHIITNHDDFESDDSVYGKPDPDNPHLCVWCKGKTCHVLAASCGHQFCKDCVEDVLIPCSACPLDNKPINEQRLTQFILMESDDSESGDVDTQGQLSTLRTRVDRLTMILDRLVEHLSIRNLLHECHLNGEVSVNVNSHNPSSNLNHHHSEQLGPIISDSEDVEASSTTVNQQTSLTSQQLNVNLCQSVNLTMLNNLPLEDEKDESTASTGGSVITTDNVRQLLPRFWQKATELKWSDEEKVQRLRMSCDSALQRLLNNADLFRKDWPYISSILYGDHLLDEVSMFRCLGWMKQRFGETPYQWYIRVCGVVERGLPPGEQRDWQVRASFISGLNPKYHEALGTGKFISITAILERCASWDVKNILPNHTAARSPKSGAYKQRTCYSCGLAGHIFRDCPKERVNTSQRWTPWH